MSCITLTTDFGLIDPFVGIMKGVLLDRAPEATVVDVTHSIPPQDVMAGALALLQAAPYFPAGTVHVAVIDPGVGGERLPIAIETDRAVFVGPDNGVLSLAAPAGVIRRVVALTESRFHLPVRSATFHGRDVFAPVAAALASGIALDSLGAAQAQIVRLTIPEPTTVPGGLCGEVIHVDRFGNLATNVSAERLRPLASEAVVHIGGQTARLVPSYDAIDRGGLGALINSWAMLEIAARERSAADMLSATRGTPVRISRRHD
jgi:S-adenosylmethionine hydrolase